MSERESLKIHEAQERAESVHASRFLAPVALTMAVLAVLAAAISTLGHRAHNEVLLLQTRANFQKAELVGKEKQQQAEAVLIEHYCIGSQNAVSTELKNKITREVERYASEGELVKAAQHELEIESD